MSQQVDLLIVGAGPAGMSAAVEARRHGLSVTVVDEQPSPGGQIWRSIETASSSSRSAHLGRAYREGESVVRAFRKCGAQFKPGTKAWQFERGPRTFMTQDGVTAVVDAKCLLLCTGAQERPVPFPGWTLPGVMTVGAGQILLKSSNQVPSEPVWIAGTGPLCFLYAVQLLKAGGSIAGFLDTTPRTKPFDLFSSFTNAILQSPGDLIKGLFWLTTLRRRVQFIRTVVDIEAMGQHALERLRYKTADGAENTVDAQLLLVHEGIVPTIHPTLSLGCQHQWIPSQDSFAPELNHWGETSEPNIFVAGDGAGIGGATAACLRGEIAALGIAARIGQLSDRDALTLSQTKRKKLKRVLITRPFLDKLYRPRDAVFNPTDKTIACRCEEVSVAEIRAKADSNQLEPDQIKAFTRAGMGPCQGRQCNYTIAHLLAKSSGQAVPDIGLYRVRPPLKPLTLDELASLPLDAGSS